MLTVKIDLGDLVSFERRARAWPALLREEMKKANVESSAALLAIVKRKLSGEALNVRTGNLRRSWTLKRPVATGAGLVGEGWEGGIGSNSSYAAYHEFGYQGEVAVRAHARLGHQVRAHTRNVSYKGHPYARPAMQEATTQIQAAHQNAVKRFIKKTDVD